MDLTIRPAARDEVDQVAGMYQWLFDPPGYTPEWWDPARAVSALAEAVESDDAVVLVADPRQGVLVGLCTAYLDLNSVRYGLRCWIEDLAVDPAHRSTGIGSRLLAAAREWASDRGATHLELDTGEARVDAQRFYERQGEARKGISYSWALRR
jgi:GNAT superfamily N-acetyltransferase